MAIPIKLQVLKLNTVCKIFSECESFVWWFFRALKNYFGTTIGDQCTYLPDPIHRDIIADFGYS